VLELVDNINEHAKTDGVIISRVWKKEKIKEIHKDKQEYFAGDRFKGVRNYLEIAVMDISEKGIIKTSIENWRETKVKEFEEDACELESMSPGEQITRFFRPEGNYFKHQALRTSACMGLLMFSQLIDNNNGFFSVVTKDSSSDKAIYYKQCFLENIPHIHETNFHGTKYDIILPVDLKNVNPFVFHEEFYEIPKAKTFMEYIARSDINYVNDKTIIINKNYKDEIIIRQDQINFDNTDENIPSNKRTWENDEAERLIKEYLAFKEKRKILCLDCENLTGNNIASFFRILAKVQENYACKAIIIFNIFEEVFFSLFDYLKLYLNRNWRLWSETHFVLGISKDYAEPFIIGGRNKEDCLCLNQYLENYYGATNTFINKIKDIIEKGGKYEFNSDRISELVGGNPLFVTDEDKSSYALIPFELFLKNKDGTTVFEKRVLSVLTNRISEDFL
jgi:hypothetical protein